ncbi:MBOAT family O-acyltransferase [Clostridium sp. SHJSY1]|uniref:MBOAT family O-acyltransferase n=1 Tax=Clostridium sp. SHJSY1 TaxID=2942483 RepID=UPI00287B8C69|nr:MBOAT family O-acyltransferase [Clostridium sp. SHJSY1]
MLCSIIINYLFAIIIAKTYEKSICRVWLSLCIAINLALLGYFKYYNFFIKTINSILGSEVINYKDIILPIGISFYTFQAISYIVDIYRKTAKVQKNPIKLALYISFFPELLSGPIIKYHDIDNQISNRKLKWSKTAYGIKRFIYGLAKKMIIANTLASCVDSILKIPLDQIGTSLAWMAVILYTFQIYYDFSGYSDMAIGLGKMFGFDFKENFNYPYLSSSVQEFWRRWHISLSTWFKEYLYIPLGGNRKSKFRTYLNLFIVFFITGLWHGASFNFIIWGMFHGFFMIIERLFLGDWLKNNKFKFLNHIYTMMVVMLGWMMFRVEQLSQIKDMFKLMFIPTKSLYMVGQFVNIKVACITLIGVLLCGLLQSNIKWIKTMIFNEEKVYTIETVFQFGLFFICTMLVVASTYKSFVYFKF